MTESVSGPVRLSLAEERIHQCLETRNGTTHSSLWLKPLSNHKHCAPNQTAAPHTQYNKKNKILRHCVWKNIPNIINCHLKKGYPILIIFSTNISGTTGHQMAAQYSTSPNVCFCTTWEKQNQRNMS